MEAIFQVKVKVHDRNVDTAFGMEEGAKDVDINLLGEILKIFTGDQKKIKNIIDKYYGEKNIPADEKPEDTAQVAAPAAGEGAGNTDNDNAE